MKMMAAACAAGLLTAVLTTGMTAFAQDKEPNVVNALEGRTPSDAVVLFNGKDLSEWVQPDGKPAAWTAGDGSFTVKKGSGIMTKKEFGDMQLHIEFATPFPPKGEGQDRGNSGVYLQGIYEVQVLDSFGNKTYIDGMVGAIYKQYPPLVNASRPSGIWQTYDIIFHAPKFDSAKKVTQKARVTILHNGVLIQDNVEIGSTPGGPRSAEAPRGPIFLQDHNHPVKFRNVWMREL
ncbi:MAG: DUF1080 domain-containing protein [Candidatus Latescibacter sp.]|nr:DUF1080 domain-containing protein [Candidatus Latescibacter sp.]